MADTNTRLGSRLFSWRLRRYQPSPARILVGGAGSIILLGTVLLALPLAAADGHSIGLVNALFTATSAVCVTGLIVLNTPVDFSTFGHVVLLFLFQVGGLGYMTAATFVALMLGRRMGLKNRLLLQEAMASPTMEGLVRLALLTVKVTLAVELVVALMLWLRFTTEMPAGEALWYGVFHAVSAFNNAGFALFQDSLLGYANDPFVAIPIGVAVVIGGLGFLVLSELNRLVRRELTRLSVHTRLTLWMTLWVGLAGSVVLLLVEHTVGDSGSGGLGTEVSRALFLGSVARTAGFATVDVAALSTAGIFLVILLMMVGGGSGSTAGGVKVSTVGVILASLWATVRGREQVTLFHRSIPSGIVQKSFFLGFMAFFLVTTVTWLVLAIEGTPLMPTLFEVASAVATVGLSFGDGAGRSLCAGFSDPGKLLVTVCMFIGRLGPLTIGIAVLRTESQQRYRLPSEKVLIG